MLKLNEVRYAWKNPIIVATGDCGNKTTKIYPIWQERKGRGYRVPTLIRPKRPPLENTVKDYYEEFRT